MIQANRRPEAIRIIFEKYEYLTLYDTFELLLRSLLPIKLIKDILNKLRGKL